MIASIGVALVLLSGASAAPPKSSLVLIDAARGKIVARIPLGGEPVRVSRGLGSFWVVLPQARSIIRVDPSAKKIVDRITVGKEPFDADAVRGVLWVPDHDGYDLLRVDLRTHGVRRSQSFGVPALAAAYGFGKVWVALADARLVSIDPHSLRVVHTIRDVAYSVEGLEPSIGFDRTGVWVADARGNELDRIDPVRQRVVFRRVCAGRGLAIAGGAAWSADGNRKIWRVAGRKVTSLTIGSSVVDVAALGGSVWTIDATEHTAVRIDARSHRVTAKVALPDYPVSVAAGGRYVAVALG